MAVKPIKKVNPKTEEKDETVVVVTEEPTSTEEVVTPVEEQETVETPTETEEVVEETVETPEEVVETTEEPTEEETETPVETTETEEEVVVVTEAPKMEEKPLVQVVEVVTTKPVEPKKVRIKLKRDHRCCIGGEWYNFSKDGSYSVSENVKNILAREDLLLPL
jgi:hypothetical protein